jgi:hypothetical protein
MLFPEGLKTTVWERSEVSTIMPGWVELPRRLIVDGETMSCSASTILITGALPIPLGNKGLETKARNLSPLSLCWLLAELLPPQHTRATLNAVSTAMLTKVFFKPETPKGLWDRDLDARKRIITEAESRDWREYRMSAGVGGCKIGIDLVFSMQWLLTC